MPENEEMYGFKKIKEMLDDLMVLHAGHSGPDEHEIYREASNRCHARGEMVKAIRKRDKINQYLEDARKAAL